MDKNTRARLAKYGREGQNVKRTFNLTNPAQTGPVKIDYGHDGAHLFIVFGRPTDHVAMDDKQAGDMIEALLSVRERLRKHIAEGGQHISQGRQDGQFDG